MTQGRQLIKALKRKAMTYGEMHSLGISTSPQKRVVECIQEGERLVKGWRFSGGRKLITWRVVCV